MALDSEKLSSDILSVFNSMKDRAQSTTNPPTDTDFSNGISNAVVTYISKGEISTNDSGKIPTGTYTGGKGKGKLTVTATNCAKIILDACIELNKQYEEEESEEEESEEDKKDYNYLAEEIGKALKKMADEGTVATTVTGGTMTPPSGQAVTGYGGSAEGTISCNSTSLVSNLKTVFSEMGRRREENNFDGNKYLADELADNIHSFWTSGTVSTNGIGNLEGSSGSGSIS